MAHMVESMMFAGEVPWHGLGTFVGGQAVTSEEAIKAAGLDWRVEKWPLFAAAPGDGILERPLAVPAQFAMVRDLDQKVLGVVGDRYTPVQNHEAFDFLDELAGQGLKYNTAGSLKGGSLIWLLAELEGTDYEPVPGDEVKRYLLFSTTHDGTSSVRVFNTDIRAVCNNTLTMALEADGKGRQAISVRHSGDVKAKVLAARSILGFAKVQAREMAEQARILASKQVTAAGLNGLLDVLMPLPGRDPETGEYLVNPTRVVGNRAKVLELFEGGRGIDIPGVRGTAWAALNAVTEFTTHYRGTRGAGDDLAKAREKRLESAWFGSGADLNTRAFSYLMAA